ncbi:MAG: cell surface protein SprA [Flavobacteriales bacterium]|nr:cell surface protein SprA [Flavobacteriales bacterium]
MIASLAVTIMVVAFAFDPATTEAFPNLNNILAFEPAVMPPDSPEIDLPYPFDDGIGGPGGNNSGGLYLNNPSNIKSGFEYDPETGTYNYYEKIGDEYFKYPTYMDFDEYINYDSEKSLQDYWKQKSTAEDIDQTKGFRPQLTVKGEAFDRIFGGNKIDIRPQGSAQLSFGINRSTQDNPALPANQRSTTTFDFNQQIQLNVIGNIGEKLKVSMNYNTEATFDFENQMKIEYTGYEDEIIQKIEAGNVSLPLKGQLITGSQTLFGIKTELKFGRMTVTSVLSQEKGEKKDINIQGGAQIQKFEKDASDYEENKHFFLAHYFRDTYENSLSTPPVITSRATITKIEIWVSNVNQSTEGTKNIIGFMDLGEATQQNIYNDPLVIDNNPFPTANFPFNNANNLYYNIADTLGGSPYNTANIRGFVNASQELEAQGYTNGIDFEKYEQARLLTPSEYTLNAQLGYVSLNSALNLDNILAVAFQYTLDGQIYQVGEFSTDGVAGQDALYVKLLKGTTINTQIPTWDLMMKNVYSLGAFNISQNDFYLDIFYSNPATGVEIPFIPEGEINGLPLVTVMNLDRLNTNNQANSDGVFDYINGVTINSTNGRVYFPVLEPFGSHLRSKFSNQQTADKFAFDTLYLTTQTLAEQDVTKNRYKIRGQYSSATTSDISLNAMNIPQGSVSVTAGGATLTENVDYTVDYNLGRVKIINEGILQSGTPIKISLESQSLFNIQTKTLMGSRFDYKVNDDFNLGGTILKLSERPLTRKVNIGDEPINNTVMGFDLTYKKDAPFLTRWADKLPVYSTKEKSSITIEGEVAKLFPGNPGAIGKDGTAYLDDFEGSQSTINMSSIFQWRLASTPRGQPSLFPEGELPLSNTLQYGYNRALFNWYNIDPLFWRNDSRTPNHIANDQAMQSNHFMREVLQTEVFPFKSQQQGTTQNIATMDLAFYPTERGPYNYDDGTGVGSGYDANGKLLNPSNRWGGIMRKVETTDFESSNVEYIQFWMMDPFNEDGDPNHPGGVLYFNLGNISEDILKDDRKAFENGLPTTAINYSTGANANLVDTTIWGRVPTVQALVNAFDNTPSTRPFQDIGLDGLNNTDEAAFFPNFAGFTDPQGDPDPAGDNYHHFRGSDYDNQQLDILQRYKMYNGLEGNSPTSDQYTESYSTSGTTRPDIEDINNNNNLDFRESYYQYAVKMNPADVSPTNVGNNYITNVFTTTVSTPDGRTRTVNWYQFKIPIREPEEVIGDIQDFKSIRFMRMFMKGFDKEIVLRFAKLELVRGEWRKYAGSLLSPGDFIGNDDDETTFNIAGVNVEENSEKTPVNYIIPPGIERQINPNPSSGSTVQQLNEQALVLSTCNLKDGDARAAFKAMDVDIRRYKRLKMFIHAEQSDPSKPLADEDLSVFIRMGSDFNDNYYEYEVPLEVTPAGTYNTDNNSNSSDRLVVWPESNNIDLQFSKLTDMKVLRNSLLNDATSGVMLIKPYEQNDGKNIMRVKGNPNIGDVRVFMIGIRNPKQSPLAPSDDGLDKCAEIWVNELRMTDFDNEGGWASVARITTQIADLGNITLAGDYSTPGWGSVEQKLNERQQETRRSYDLSTSVELGKFIPEKIGISIPMYYNVSEGIVTPRYNPLDPDLELKELLKNELLSQEERDSIGVRTQEVTHRRSINFTNVRKLPAKNKKKNHFYDISNLSFNYGYSETKYRDINTEFDNKKTYRGGFGYAFSNNPKNYKPFANGDFAKKKAFKLISDFNFYLAPKQLTFQTDMDRMYSERQARNNTGFSFSLPTYYQKHFYWNRVYGLKYDLTKNLKFDFNATNNATIEEPLTFDGTPTNGRVDNAYKAEYASWRDTVWQNIRDFGTNTHYHHNFNVNYAVPIDKLPYLDFLSLTSKYSGDYDWQRAPIGADTLGHTIQNSNTISLNAQMNMTKLHNQIGFLQKVQKRAVERERRRAQNNLKPDKDKTQAQNAKAKGWKEGVPPADIKFDLKNFKDSDTTRVELWRKKLPFKPMDVFWQIMMSPKNISGTYSRNRGTLLPGYAQETELLGYNPGFTAPGFNFVSGIQEEDFALNAADRDWLVTKDDPQYGLMYNYATTYAENYSLRATVRPIKTLRIQLTANRTYSTNLGQQFFEIDPATFVDTLSGELRNNYYFVTPIETGNFSMSFLSFNTAFAGDDELSKSSSVFESFLTERAKISQRLAQENGNSFGTTQGYADGYGGTSQDVLIPTFVAAYSGKDGNDVSLADFTKYIPLPNWRITYDGLSKLKFVNRVFKNFTLNHSYKSTLNVSSFTTNLLYEENNQGASARDINSNFIPELQVSNVSISEQFSPLLGAEMTMHNDMLLRVEYKKDRNASLSMSNNQITEIKGAEWSIGTGYKFRQVRMPFAKSKMIKSDIDTRIDFVIRKNNTIIRKIVEEVNQLTAGQRVFSIKFTADYRVSKTLNIRAFYDYVATNPYISTTFPTSNTNAGFSLRFTLAQ